MKGQTPFKTDLRLLMGACILLMILLGPLAVFAPPAPWWRDHWEREEDAANDPRGNEPVVYQTVNETVLELVGYTNEGGSDYEGFRLDDSYKSLQATLTWHDSDDTLQLSLDHEGDVLQEQTTNSGIITLDLSETMPGDYNLTITAVECKDGYFNGPLDQDNNQEWILRVTARREVPV